MLPPPAAREKLHHRAIAIEGFLRDDGAIDVEAHMTDVKTYDFPRDDGGTKVAGTPVHDMWLRLTMSPTREIMACEAAMDATPFSICPQVAPNFARLAGLRIEAGFVRAAMARVGGPEGCTHLRELLQQMGTVAFQTLYSVRKRTGRAPVAEAKPEGRPAMLDSCYAYSAKGELVRERFPAFFTGLGASQPAP